MRTHKLTHIRPLLLAALAIIMAIAMMPSMSAYAASPPVPGNNGTLTVTLQDDITLDVSWTAATDTDQYQIYTSKNPNITTAQDAEANGTPAYQDNKKPTSSPGVAMGLAEDTDYYVNVVAEGDGGKTAYTMFGPIKSGNSWRFKIYEKYADTTDPIEVKNYSLAELYSMVPENAEPRGFMQATWTIFGTKTYVKVPDLLTDANVPFAVGDSISCYAPDGFGATFTYEVFNAAKYFFPAATATGKSTDGMVEAGAVIALKWDSKPIGSLTAGAALNEAVATEREPLRFLIGLSEANYASATAAGNRLVKTPDRITVTHPYSKALADKIADLQNQVNDKQSQIDDTQSKLDDTQSKLDDKQAQLDSKTKEASTHSASNTTLQAQITDLQTQLNTKITEATTHATNSESLTTQVSTLQAQLDTANKTIFKNTNTKISKIKAGKKQATVTWKKIAAAEGYQISYSTSKSFKGAKPVTVKKGSTVSQTVKGLVKGKTYYVKVRGYAKIGGAWVYTPYSTVQKVKVK